MSFLKRLFRQNGVKPKKRDFFQKNSCKNIFTVIYYYGQYARFVTYASVAVFGGAWG